MAEKVSKDKVVSIHYVLKDEKGKVLESSLGEEPLIYLHGHNDIIKGLESGLSGKSVGYKGRIQVNPENGYGDYNEDLVVTFNKSEFNQGNVTVGAFFKIMNDEGEEMVVRATKVKKDTITLDGNHPFAGKNLFFDVEVIEVRKATKKELKEGHATIPV